MTDALNWNTDGPAWPLNEASRFVEAGGVRFHVQVTGKPLGEAPVALLIHGTGASTHSWRRLVPHLREHFTLVMPDLPGHAFTSTPAEGSGLSLAGMSAALSALVKALNVAPALAVGHSAGAAILMRMALDGGIAPKLLISLNGALLPLQGFAGQFFSPLAKLIVLNPLTPRLFAWRAGDRGAVERVLGGTGSSLDTEGVDLYRRLFQSPAHIAGTLGMMARWELEPLRRDMPRLQTPLLLVACGADKAIAPDTAFKVRDLIPSAKVEYLRDLGHLAHEEHPEAFAKLILNAAAAQQIVQAAGGIAAALF
jgi:magnesium chelatase accessory protein